tara:strand:- start:3 stop:503 length:501 start_codon:yes stop_codon:yes gene_type:complete
MFNSYSYSLLIISSLFSQSSWYDGNLKYLNDVTFTLNVKGIDDGVWEKRLSSYIELRLLEHNIRFNQNQMPKMVIDINVIDSRVDQVSSFQALFSIYNYSVSETDYYGSMADTVITKKLMTSKVFSKEIMGQTSSQNLYKDIERGINSLVSHYLEQWYIDNPMKQF